MSTCISCLKGKQSRLPFPVHENSSKELLHLVHTDLCGPMEEDSLGGNKYFLTFIDDFSRKTFIFLIKNKNEVRIKFEEFKAFAENQTGKKLRLYVRIMAWSIAIKN